MLPQFDSSTYSSQIFWLIIAFTLLYYMISKFVTPRAENIFAKREEVVKMDANIAEETSKEVIEIKLRVQTEMKETVNAAEKMSKEAISKLENDFELKRTELKKTLNENLTRALKELEQSLGSLENEKQQASLMLAATIIEKITSRPANVKLLEQCYQRVR